MKRKSSHNRLFALEQSLQNHCQTELEESKQPQAKDQDQQPTTVTAMAFDFDEAIELSYSESYHSSSNSAAQSIAEEQSWSTAMGSAATAYEVESFEAASSPGSAHDGATSPDAVHPTRDASDRTPEPQPVQATIVPDTAPQPYKSAQPAAENTDYAKAASDEDVWSGDEDAQAFAADIQAILQGEKTYDPNQQRTIDTAATSQPAPDSSPAQAAPPPAPESTPTGSSHAIFDQMAKNMTYARAYDLGDLSLQQRFDAFDRMLGYENQETLTQMQSADPEYEPLSFSAGLDEELAAVRVSSANLANSASYKALLADLIQTVPQAKKSVEVPAPTGKKAASKPQKGKPAPKAPVAPTTKKIVTIELEGTTSAQFCVDGDRDLYIEAFKNNLNGGKWQKLPEVNYARVNKPDKISYQTILNAIHDSQKWTAVAKEQQPNFVILVAVIAEAARFELIQQLIDRIIQSQAAGTTMEVPYEKFGPIVNNWSKLREKQANRPYIELSALKNSENLTLIAPTDTDKKYVQDLLAYLNDAEAQSLAHYPESFTHDSAAFTESFAYAEEFAATSQSLGESFDLRYEVPLIPQQPGMSAWAAAAAMLIAWRDQIPSPINFTELANGTGIWAKYKSGLQLETPELFKIWGLLTKPARTYSVEELKQLVLEVYGPLWVAAADPGSHIRVITGLAGDDTPNGTKVYINDPWEANMTAFKSPNAGAQVVETYQQFIQKQSRLAKSSTSTPGLLIAHLPEPSAAELAKMQSWEDEDFG